MQVVFYWTFSSTFQLRQVATSLSRQLRNDETTLTEFVPDCGEADWCIDFVEVLNPTWSGYSGKVHYISSREYVSHHVLHQD